MCAHRSIQKISSRPSPPAPRGSHPACRKYTYAAASPGGCKVKWTAEEKPHGGAGLSSGRRSSPPPTTTASISSESGRPSPSPAARPRPSEASRMTRRSRRGSVSRAGRSPLAGRPDRGTQPSPEYNASWLHPRLHHLLSILLWCVFYSSHMHSFLCFMWFCFCSNACNRLHLINAIIGTGFYGVRDKLKHYKDTSYLRHMYLS